MTGISVNRTFGSDSYKYPVSLLHLHPSMKRPWTLTPSTGPYVTSFLKYGFISALKVSESIAI